MGSASDNAGRLGSGEIAPVTRATGGELSAAVVTGVGEDFEVVLGGVFKATAGTDPVEIPPKVKFEQHGGMVAGSTDGGFIPKFEPEGLEIQAIDKGIDGTHRILAINKIVCREGQKHCFATI